MHNSIAQANFYNKSIDLVENYDHFILDIWGVIHDGSYAYDGVVESLNKIRSLGKKIYLLSNAPRRSFKVVEILKKFDITSDLYDSIMTSGEATYVFLAENQNNNFQKYGQNYYYIGPKKDGDLLDGLNYKRVLAAQEADFAIVTGFDGDFSKSDEKTEDLQQSLKYNLPLICVNPDLVVIKKTGQELHCAGLIAQQYQEMGGKVFYFGKPYEAVYSTIFSANNITDKDRVLAIGDGLGTDIKGANNYNIDSALIPGGILSNILDIKHGQLPQRDKMLQVCQEYNIFPKFILGQL